MNEINKNELYNLTTDPEENINLAQIYPEWTKKILKIADSIRFILGDKLLGIKGIEVRPVGRDFKFTK